MLANRFVGCQSARRVCYSRQLRPHLSASIQSLQGPRIFGLFPKFSTAVEKTVEIQRDASVGDLITVFVRLYMGGQTSKPLPNKGFLLLGY